MSLHELLRLELADDSTSVDSNTDNDELIVRNLNAVINGYTTEVASKESLEDYVSLELMTKFNVSAVSDNFKIGDDWLQVLEMKDVGSTDCVVLQIILSLADASLVNGQRLGTLSRVPGFLDQLHELLKSNSVKDQLIEKSYIKLYHLILKVSCKPENILRLLDDIACPPIGTVITKLSQNINEQSDFLQLENVYKIFDLRDAQLTNKCTLSLQVELTNTSSNRIMTLNNHIFLEIRDEKFCICNDEYILAIFENFEFEQGKLYSLSMTIDKRNFSLYVNGNLITEIKLVEDLTKYLKWIEIGSIMCSFRLFNFQIYSTILNDYKIKLLSLSKGIIEMDKSLNYIIKTNTPFIEEVDNKQILLDSKKFQISEREVVLKYSSKNETQSGTDYKVSLNGAGLEEDDDSFGVTCCHIYKKANLMSCFETINGISILLDMIYSAKTEDELKNEIRLLFNLFEDSFTINKFQESYGFSFLSYLLLEGPIKKLKTPLSIDIMKDISSFYGWDFENSHKSIIRYPEVLQEIILNLQLWHNIDVDERYNRTTSNGNENFDLETVRFILFQITCLVEQSQFHLYNRNLLERIGLLETLSQQLHNFERKKQLRLLTSCNEEIINTFTAILNNTKSSEQLKWLLKFLYFELKAGCYIGFETKVKTLNEILTNVLNNTSSMESDILINSIIPKMLFMLLEETTKLQLNPIVVLSTMLKFYLINQDYWNRTLQSGGISILTEYLARIKPLYFEEIVKMLYLFSIGKQQFQEFGNITSIEDIDESSLDKEKISIDGFLLLIVYLEWGCINDIHQDHRLDMDNFFCYMLETMNKHLTNENMTTFGNKISDLIITLIDLQITVSKPQNGSLYSATSNALSKLINALFIKDISHKRIENFKAYFMTQKDLLTVPFSRKGTIDKNNYLLFFFMRKIFPDIMNNGFNETPNVVEDDKSLPTFGANMVELLLCLYDEFIHIKNDDNLEWLKYFLQCSDYFSNYTINNTKLKNKYLSLLKMLILNLMSTIHFQKLDAKSEECEYFYKAILTYQYTIFNREFLGSDGNFITSLIIFIGLEINENRANSMALDCLRAIVLHQQKYLSSISSIINQQYKTEVTENLEKLLCTDNDEAVSMLIENCYFLFSVNQKYRIEEYMKTHIHIPNVPINITENQIIQEILLQREDRLSHHIASCKEMVNLFIIENHSYFVKILKMFIKLQKNYETDLREESFISENKARRIQKYHLNFSETHKIITDNVVWGLDSLEDDRKTRRRVVHKYKLESQPTRITNVAPTSDVDKNHLIPDIKNTESLSSFELVPEIELATYSDSIPRNENRRILKMLKDGDSIQNIWNCSLVEGLEIKEGMLIIGHVNMYFIDGFYFFSSEKRVLQIMDVPDYLRDTNINYLKNINNENRSASLYSEEFVVEKEQLNFVTKRPYLLTDTAMEMLFEDGRTYLFNFKNKAMRDELYKHLSQKQSSTRIDYCLAVALKEINLNSNKISSQNGIVRDSLKFKFTSAFSNPGDLFDNSIITREWQNGNISNFMYIMILNMLAGRTFNDLTQYPIFPWVLSNYDENTIDLTENKNYRDLTKPMGAQSERRCKEFIERYELLKDLDPDSSVPFHYGTHYSSAMIVAGYLIRLEPFYSTFKSLQDGHIGHPDRLFSSVSRAWKSAAIESTTDVRELTPEFFYLPEFLKNINIFDFGKCQDGTEVNNVALPPWSGNDPKLFVTLNRRALESEYVSENLHIWIDLIFGQKQRGPESVKAINVFNSLSYPGNINLDKVNDENERKAITGIIHNFGQTPLQIFHEAHPKRQVKKVYSVKSEILDKLNVEPDEIISLDEKYESSETSELITMLPHNNAETPQWKCADNIRQYLEDDRGTFHEIRLDGRNSIHIGGLKFDDLHQSRICIIKVVKSHYLITADEDGLIKVWDINLKRSKLLEFRVSLCGHLSEVTVLQAFEGSNVLITLDIKHQVYLWDLSTGLFIRKISSDAKLITISEVQGNIAVLSIEGELTLWNLNGDKYLNCHIPHLEGSVVKNINFFDFTKTEHQFAKHRYWFEHEILMVACNDGCLRLYELAIESASWQLNLIKILKASTSDPIFASATIGYIHNKRGNHTRTFQLATLAHETINTWILEW
ncbi:Bph1p RNJ42_03089 [Nakaseomyces bracarensis]|uniref:Bph1p n=1 Tax=Nakaseomyces bracarensis TaxID=273131 RepID=UPI003871D8D8